MATHLEPAELRQAVSRYAGILHAACLPEHHVVSPLGAWLLLALIAPAADGADRDALAGVLGTDPDRAAATAVSMLGDVHPDVSAAAAAWFDGELATEALHTWTREYGDAVSVGEIPDQAAADEWTRRGSLGLIPEFPFDLVVTRPDALMATVLATRSVWRTALGAGPSTELGAGTFPDQVDRALRADPHDPGHDAGIGSTDEIGDVVVHGADAGTGLSVWSVCAAADVPPADVLATAYAIATDPDRPRRRLADLPLGESDRWTIREHVEDVPPDATGDETLERILAATLPAWSATADVELLAVPGSGFVPASRTLGRLVGLTDPALAAKQVAVARFHREGFEAAAVTAAMAMRSMPVGWVERRVRNAWLRFPHPYAVVATTTPTHEGVDAVSTPAAWDNLPVFSAWVATAEEPGDDEEDVRA